MAPSPNKSIFLDILGAGFMVQLTFLKIIIGGGQNLSHFLETILSRAVVVAMHEKQQVVPDDRWCGSPVPGGRGREPASRQAAASSSSLLARSQLARSQKLRVQTHARRCPFSTTSSG